MSTNALEKLRDELVDAYNTGGLNAHPTVPEKISPPATFVGPASDPYVTLEGAMDGCCLVRHQTVIAVGKAANKKTTAEVDRRMLVALAVLPGHFAVVASGVGRVPLNGQEYVGGFITTQTEMELPTLDELTPQEL